jgi:hypothetical protein
MSNIVYWIYEDGMTDYRTQGYIGITSKPATVRHKQHILKNPHVHAKTFIRELFVGTREECFKREFEYRPVRGIGWNRAVGGSHGWRNGFTHTDAAKAKMAAAWTPARRATASVLKTEENKKLIGQKRPAQSAAMAGEGNSMAGRNHTNKTREKMSLSRKGKATWNKGKHMKFTTRTCPHCGLIGDGPNMTRYHFENCKELV